MTCVLCANVPQAIDFKTLSKHLKDCFPNPESQRYIDEIGMRANVGSARESLCSLWLLKIATLIFQDLDAKSLVFKKTSNGKPYFEGSKLKFSISHSKGFLACAISDESELGIDIEASDITVEQAKKIAKRFFATSEYSSICENPEFFKKAWCEKEAKAKFFGITLAQELKNEKLQAYPRCNKLSNLNIKIHGFEYKKQPVSLCTEDKIYTIEFIEIDLDKEKL